MSLLALMFTAAWRDHSLDAILDPAAGRLSNTDGDDLLFVSVRYGFKPGVMIKAVRAALESCSALRRETANFWTWVDYDRPETPKPSNKKKGLTIGSWLDDGATVLGNVEIKGRAVVLEANSAARHDALRAVVEPLLQGLVAEPCVNAQSWEDMQAADDAPGRTAPSAPPSEEQKVALQAWQDR